MCAMVNTKTMGFMGQGITIHTIYPIITINHGIIMEYYIIMGLIMGLPMVINDHVILSFSGDMTIPPTWVLSAKNL